MQSFKPWTTSAVNRATKSGNPVHDDRAAKQLGFTSGLVPGATLFAYLVHPALERWQERWLDRGHGSIVLIHPFHATDPVVAVPKADGPKSYACELRSRDGRVCATGTASIPDVRLAPPFQRDDPPAPATAHRPVASRTALEWLMRAGMGSLRLSWRSEPPYDQYTRDQAEMPSCVRPDQRAFANPAFLVNLANRALTANVRLGPWIHTESEVQNFSRLALGRCVDVESSVLDLFERGGHEFCDLQVNVFLKEGEPIATIRHRVIYLLRQLASA